jgi:hypothetical protein
VAIVLVGQTRKDRNTVETGPVAPVGFSTLVLNEDWSSGSINPARWDVEASTYGSPARYGRYRPENAVVSAATTGGTGNSLKLTSKREFFIDRDFTGGMLGTNTIGVYYPPYAWYEARMKIPVGQGIWPAFWLRHRDGSSICEVDIMESFHAEVPGSIRLTVHYTDNGSVFHQNAFKVSTFCETPSYTPGWHKVAMSIAPTVDPDKTQFTGYLDGVQVYSYLQPSSTNWTSRYAANAFDICLQGSQIGGPFTGHPDDPLGYSRNRVSGGVTGGEVGGCIIGGTAPSSCTITTGGQTTIAPIFPATFEIDYVRVWGYTG